MMAYPDHLEIGHYDFVQHRTGWCWHIMNFDGVTMTGGPFKTEAEAADDLFALLKEAGVDHT